MKPRPNPIDAAVARFVSDFVAIIEDHVARAIGEAMALGGTRRKSARRKRAAARAVPAKARRQAKRTAKKASAAAAKGARAKRKKGAKASSKRTEQLSLF